MAALREWLRRLWGTLRKNPQDADMEQELRLHLEMLADDLRRRGVSPAEAMRQARLQAGAIAEAMERRRDQRGLPWLQDLLQDLRLGTRLLCRAPGFTLVALATLTLAIGANTAIFSLVDPLLFRDLPVRDPAGLVQFTFHYPFDPPLNMFSVANYERYRDGNTVFSDVFGLTPLSTEAHPGEAPIGAEVVTGNFFQALGVQAAQGRLLASSDDRPGAALVAVISWQYWTSRLNRDGRVLGSVLDIADTRVPAPMHVTVVGVAQPAFSGIGAGYAPDIWMSLSAVPEAMRSKASLSLVARLKPGASIAQAGAEMRVLDRPRIDALAKGDPQWLQAPIEVTPARTGLDTPLQQQFGGPLRLLMTLVCGLLLLACANLGSLLLARGAAREHEMAVRVSLGAGRLRLMRQVLAESLLLASLGSVLGVMGARFAAPMLMRIMIAGTRSIGPSPRPEIPLDVRVLVFTMLATAAAALVFGLAPTVAALVSAPADALRHGRAAQPRSRRVFGNGLVVGQVAISLALISVAQLYIGHLRDLRGPSLGFDRDGVLLFSVNNARAQNRQQLAALYRELAARLQAVPGVRSVAASAATPLSPGAASRFLHAEGFDQPAASRMRVALNWVSPDYFATYGTPLLAGRDFRDADTAQPRCVIVNQAVAQRYFAGREAVGRRIWLENERDPYEIVGIVGNAKYPDVHLDAREIVYVFAPMSRGPMQLSLRTIARPTAVAVDAGKVVDELLGPDAVRHVTTLAKQVDAAVVPERLMAILAGFFGLVGALLAAIGLYGLLAYTVERRTREIGVHMALGAAHGDVVRMVLANTGWLVVGGLLIGAPAAFWSKRVAATMLEKLPAGGVLPIGVAAAAMIAVALLAAYIPARRATRIEPLTALRTE